MMGEGFIELDVPLTAKDEAEMILRGFATRDPDGVLRITRRGAVWINNWCRDKLHEVQEPGPTSNEAQPGAKAGKEGGQA